MNDYTGPTLEQLEYLAGKAMAEPDFRALLLAEPERTARSVNIQLTPGQVNHIKSLNQKVIEDLADALDQLVDPASVVSWH